MTWQPCHRCSDLVPESSLVDVGEGPLCGMCRLVDGLRAAEDEERMMQSTAEAFERLRHLPEGWDVDMDGSFAPTPLPETIDRGESWLAASGLAAPDADNIDADVTGGIGLYWSQQGRTCWIAFHDRGGDTVVCSNSEHVRWHRMLEATSPEEIRRWLDLGKVPTPADQAASLGAETVVGGGIDDAAGGEA